MSGTQSTESSSQQGPFNTPFSFGGQTAQTGAQTTFGGSGGGFFGSTAQQQPQQQQQGFGLQQQQQGFGLQQQQGGGGLFQQQQLPQQYFGQQQPQQGANNQANGPKEAKGVTSDILEWVAGSNGSIPEDAVEGGWCSSTQEHYYIARAKDASTGGVYPGYVLPSKKLFYFVSKMIDQRRRGNFYLGGGNQMQVGTNPNYKVLVNPNKAETLSWVYLHFNQGFGLSSIIRNIVPVNALEAGYANNGSSLFIGRTCSHATGDIVPGAVHSNALVYTENEGVASPSINFFEILCVTKKDETAKAKDVFLYDIKYKMENAFIKWSQVPLEKAALVNKSSVKQKMSSSHQPGIPTTFKWTVNGSDIIGNTEVQIKGPVPTVFGGNKSHRLHLLDGQRFLNLLPTGRGGIDNAVFGGVVNPGQYSSPNLSGMFVPTLITMPLANCLQIENTAGQESCTLAVPPSCRVILQIQGIQAELCVPFEGKLKIIYTNNHVEDIDIEGTYDHTSIKGTAMAVMDEKPVVNT
uniref:Uncharacterized protein n=1 Tax=Amphimedon queenslandica TaxID=400682 RepID=A0A1X7VGI4_AMPQE